MTNRYYTSDFIALNMDTPESRSGAMPITLTVFSDSMSLAFDTQDVRRHYSQVELGETFNATNCSPLTPVAQMNGYRDTANAHRNTMQGIVSGLGPNSLHMGAFANALNAYASFLRSLPQQFCVGPSNQAAFDQMDAATTNASAVAQQGIQIFENNYGRFAQQVTPLLQTVGAESRAITGASRDFRRVMTAVDNYQNFVRQFVIEVWTLSERIRQIDTQLGNLVTATDRELGAALNQIETNVENESNRFVQQQRSTEEAFRVWDKEDGFRGYKSYESIVSFVRQLLVPEYNDFLGKVPQTQRVRAAVNLAQSALNQILGNFEAFPTFRPLPPPSDSFPHVPVFNENRQFGEEEIIEIVRRASLSHFTDTGNKLRVGNLQYEHGGKMSPHTSHRRGIDADIDPIEVGNIPGHNKALALAVAKRFLAAGAQKVLYADADVVSDANEWAQNQGLSGRLIFEASHTNHFHLRASE